MAIANTGCIQGKVVLRIPLGDTSDPARYTTFPLPDVTVALSNAGKGVRSAGARNLQTDADGRFCFDNLAPGAHHVLGQRARGQADRILDGEGRLGRVGASRQPGGEP